MLELKVLGVSQPNEHPYPVVLLQHESRILPILVGLAEASAIQLGLTKEKTLRPMTHDLVCNLLAGLRANLQSITIYRLEKDTFYAHLNVEQLNGQGHVEQVLRIDSRPSDAIAVAIRMECPIFVAEEVMDVAAQDASIFSSDGELEGEGEDFEGDSNEDEF